ncbi:hypothetical protein IE077_004303 [Cardiosporidium cionae]|uniref:Uncharacterized protein n=1 Tax=Cardiosporidium cionae TaxID=476202 RepID=A0ABQ7J523_9APIC|nr:hypothetical protein IE077_004303 [Cardiosporidium cionae]|eukprot:KAF8819069.1 hypothetical protein IE077_004303 [Cardiosporidium cionae]
MAYRPTLPMQVINTDPLFPQTRGNQIPINVSMQKQQLNAAINANSFPYTRSAPFPSKNTQSPRSQGSQPAISQNNRLGEPSFAMRQHITPRYTGGSSMNYSTLLPQHQIVQQLYSHTNFPVSNSTSNNVNSEYDSTKAAYWNLHRNLDFPNGVATMFNTEHNASTPASTAVTKPGNMSHVSHAIPYELPQASPFVPPISQAQSTIFNAGHKQVLPCNDSIKNSLNSLESITLPENTLIILDYDDTLLPTNWVAVHHKIGLNDSIPPLLQNHLAELSGLAIKTIDFCRKTGRLIVVTNASAEWVMRSGEKFIPTVWNHLKSCEIEIVSARDRWQSTGLPQRHWKLKIFEEAIRYAFEKQVQNGKDCCVISIGDGEGEREACLEMWRQTGVNEWMFKSLKLLAQPTCNQLISEHLLIQQAFPDILKVPQSLDMAILDYKQNSQQNYAVPPNVKVEKNQLDFLSESFLSNNSNAMQNTKLYQEEELFERDMTRPDSSKALKSPLQTDAFIDAISEQLKQSIR